MSKSDKKVTKEARKREPPRQAFVAERRSFHDLLSKLNDRIIIAIGVANGGEARRLHHSIATLEKAGRVPDHVGGFVFFVSGYLCAAGAGLPDLGLVLRDEIMRTTDVVEQATWMAALDTQSAPHPIGVDIDTGYGNEASAVILSCRQAHKQGASYVQIEDQLDINKSCGHMSGSRGQGKDILDVDMMIARRLKPALSYARSQPDFEVVARTDALQTLGFDAAVDRANAYAEAGARLLFVEAPQNREQLDAIPKRVRQSGIYHVANMVDGSPHTPMQSARELGDMGYAIALFPIGAHLAANVVQKDYYDHVLTGQAPADRDIQDEFAENAAALGKEQIENWNRVFGG